MTITKPQLTSDSWEIRFSGTIEPGSVPDLQGFRPDSVKFTFDQDRTWEAMVTGRRVKKDGTPAARERCSAFFSDDSFAYDDGSDYRESDVWVRDLAGQLLDLMPDGWPS